VKREHDGLRDSSNRPAAEVKKMAGTSPAI
jgi:hypothetical protein